MCSACLSVACGLSTSQFLQQHPQVLQPQEDSHLSSTDVGLTTRSGALTELCISAMCSCAMASQTVPVEMMRLIVPLNLVHVPRYKLVRRCVGCGVFVAEPVLVLYYWLSHKLFVFKTAWNLLKFQQELLGLVDITVEFWSIKCNWKKRTQLHWVSILTT